MKQDQKIIKVKIGDKEININAESPNLADFVTKLIFEGKEHEIEVEGYDDKFDVEGFKKILEDTIKEVKNDSRVDMKSYEEAVKSIVNDESVNEYVDKQIKKLVNNQR